MNNPSELPQGPRGGFIYRWSVRVAFTTGLVSLSVGVLALTLGVLRDEMLRNEAAFWLAVAVIAFGLTAIATRP
jgi:hypothetical protein